MCGRFTLRTPTPVLMKEFQLAAAPEMRLRFNIAPTQDVAVVRQDAEHRREMVCMRWGLIPSWAKDPSIGNRLINARSETAATKPSFRAAMKRRRCLVVADGYYEWKRIGKGKQPYFIRMENERPFAMAGLWETWKGPADGDPLLTCAILTTSSNELTRGLHDRMPVILAKPMWDVWLDTEQTPPEELQPLLAPYDSDAMHLEAVSSYVNNARHEGPECIALAEA